MLHYEESPENLNIIWQPPFLDTPHPPTPAPPILPYPPPFLSRPSHFHQFWKSQAPPFAYIKEKTFSKK